MLKKFGIMVFIIWAGFVTYKISNTPFGAANAATTFTFNKACKSTYEVQSTSGSNGWTIYTNLAQYINMANPNVNNWIWGYTTCNTNSGAYGDYVIAVRLHPYGNGGSGAGTLGLDIVCCAT